MIYVMSDIHGCYDLYMKMLKEINFSDNDLMFILGDVIDRGPEPIKILGHLIENTNIILLMGNHERMMIEYFDSNSRNDNWLYNGGFVTHEKLSELNKEKANEIYSYVRSLKLTYRIRVNNQLYRLVHAGLEYLDKCYCIKQSEDYMLWSREEFYDNMDTGDDVVLFGHTPTMRMYSNEGGNSTNIWHGKNKIGLDCGAVFLDKLGCLRLDDMKEFYVTKGEE